MTVNPQPYGNKINTLAKLTSKVTDDFERWKVKGCDHVSTADVPDRVHQLHKFHHLLIGPTHTQRKEDLLLLRPVFRLCKSLFIVFCKLSPKGRLLTQTHPHMVAAVIFKVSPCGDTTVCVWVHETGCCRTEEPVVTAAALRNLHLINQNSALPRGMLINTQTPSAP